MFSFLTNQDYYSDFIDTGDSRVKDWPLMEGPIPTISICLSYVMFVKVIGPQLMKNREPINVKALMVIYNFAMVFLSIYLFIKLGIHGWFGKYNYKCQPVDYSDSEDAIGMASISYLYYISKFIEFADTIFFVLRKKYSHISTLHVIHHGVMPMSVWWGVKFTPGGHSTFFAFINSFVHILMYIYYGLASIGPQMNKYLWWKKYMTSIQMVQFIMIFVHSFQLIFRDCNYPRGFMWWIGFHAVLFWFLFADFYRNTYQRKINKTKLNLNGDLNIKHNNFFACTQTEKLINSLNGENAIKRKNIKPTKTATTDDENIANGAHSNADSENYSRTVKNSLTNDLRKNGL